MSMSKESISKIAKDGSIKELRKCRNEKLNEAILELKNAAVALDGDFNNSSQNAILLIAEAQQLQERVVMTL